MKNFNTHDLRLDTINNRGHLNTEKLNPKSKGLDKLSTESLVTLFNQEDKIPQESVERAKLSITNAIEAIYARVKKGGRLFYLGAGTSGRLGVLDAAECPPTFCCPPDLVNGLIAGGSDAMHRSSEYLEDNEEDGKLELIKYKFSSLDSLIGITAGGTTPYVIGALKYALDVNGLAIALACVSTDEAILPCTLDIRLETGPELLSGSTRLKAGTATKMTLNIISTALMIRLGKVYSNMMVDLSATNFKLIDRSLRILETLAKIDREKGIEVLRQASGSVKLALLISISKLDPESSIKLLEHHDGNLRSALDSIGCCIDES